MKKTPFTSAEHFLSIWLMLHCPTEMQFRRRTILSETSALLGWGRSADLAGGGFAGSLGGEAKFAEIMLCERSLGITDGLEVLSFDFLVDFASVDGNGLGSFNSDPHIVTIDTLNDENNIVSNLNRFVNFSGKSKHR